MDNFERDSYYFSSYIYGENEQKEKRLSKCQGERRGSGLGISGGAPFGGDRAQLF